MEPPDDPRQPPFSSLPHRRMLADFCSLSMRILRLANRGVSKREFVGGTLQLLARFSGCDALRLRIEEKGGGTAWRAWLDGEDRFHVEPDDGPAPEEAPAGGTRLRLPFTVDARTRGTLELLSCRADAIREREIEFYEGLVQTLGVAIADRRAQEALRERVKELTCLYAIAQLIQQPDTTLAELLQRIADLLPPAFQHPQAAAARIRLDSATVTSPGFAEGRFRLRSPVRVGGGERGAVEVHYPAEGLDPREDPFLPEERSLLDEVARRVAHLAESRRLEEQLRHADRLATIGELAAGVAHEINEPLGSILGFAQLARKGAGLPEQAGQDLDQIVQASLHAREIVRKLLIFSRQMPTRKTRRQPEPDRGRGLELPRVALPRGGDRAGAGAGPRPAGDRGRRGAALPGAGQPGGQRHPGHAGRRHGSPCAPARSRRGSRWTWRTPAPA